VIWTGADFAARGGWKDYRWQAAILVLLTAAIIWVFR
jgi:hypothetical protein